MGFDIESIVALSSGTVVLIVFGSIYTFGALIPYINSYLFYQGHPTTNTALSILFTLTIININVGAFVSSVTSSKISNRASCIIAVAGMSLGVLLCSFMTNFIGFVIFYGVVYGLFIGIGYLPPLQNAYLHLPHKKGLCSGICMSGFGLGSGIFNYIILALINPNNVEVDKETKLYPQHIANNLPFALKIIALIYFSMGMISSVLIRPPKYQKKDNFSVLSQDSIGEIKQTNKAPQKKDRFLIRYFFKRKAHFIMAQVVLIAPFGMFTAFNYKRLAFERNPYFLQNDYLVTTIGSVGIFCNGLFRALWGYLFDHISFKKIVVTINICLLVFSGAILFAVQNVVTYFIIIPCIYISYGGLYAILPTQVVRVLGSQKGAKAFWLAFTGFSVAAIIQFTTQYFMLTYIQQNGYYYCIGLFFVLQLIGLIVSIMVNYQYEQSQMLLMKKKKKKPQPLVNDKQQQQQSHDYI